MNPIALALAAIKQHLAASPQMGTAVTDPETLNGFKTMPAQGSTPQSVGNGLDTSMFTGMPESQNKDNADAGSDFLKKFYEKQTQELAKSAEKLRQLQDEHDQKTSAFMQLHHPDLVKPKKLTDSQLYIPALLGLVANLSPEVRRTNAANQAAQGYWNSQQQGNQQDAELQNAQNDAMFKDQYNRAALGLKESGDTLDRANQDYTNLLTRSDATAARLAGTLDTNQKRLVANDARIAGKQRLQETINKLKDPAEVQRFMMDANAAAVQQGQEPWYTVEEIAQVPLSKNFKELAQGKAATANANLADQKASVIVDQAMADIGLKNATAAQREMATQVAKAHLEYLPFEENLKQLGIDIRRDQVAAGWARVEIARQNLDERIRAGNAKEAQTAQKTAATAANSLLKELGVSQRAINAILSDPIKVETLKKLPSNYGNENAYDDYVKAGVRVSQDIEKAKSSVTDFSGSAIPKAPAP